MQIVTFALCNRRHRVLYASSCLLCLMQVYIEASQTTKQMAATKTVQELLGTLGYVAEDVLVVVNGSVVMEDEPLKEEDEVKILAVVSGG